MQFVDGILLFIEKIYMTSEMVIYSETIDHT